MVLGEFTEEEKEIVFSDLKLRQYLINEIIDKVEDLNELPELKSEEVVINLALEYLLEKLEDPEKEEDNDSLFLGIEQVYLMANYEFIKDNIDYGIEDYSSAYVPEDVINNLKESYEKYLDNSSANPKLTYEEFEATIYNLGKAEIILKNAENTLIYKMADIDKDKKRVANIEAKIEELQEQLK